MPKDGDLARKVVTAATGKEHKTTRPSTIGTENGAMTMPLTLVETVNETVEVHTRWPDRWVAIGIAMAGGMESVAGRTKS